MNILSSEPGWLHGSPAVNGLTPLDLLNPPEPWPASQIIDFTDCDVRMDLLPNIEDERRTAFIAWIEARKLQVGMFIFTPDALDADDQLVFRFQPQDGTEAVMFKMEWC